MHTPSTNQITQGRTPGMRQAIKEFNGPINMLEIGTWYGEGSTQVWLDELKSGSSITLLDSWNPYCHNDYNDTVFDYKNMDAKVHDAFIKTFELLDNCSGEHSKITLIGVFALNHLIIG